uniref:Pentacotripeptide-repeat region of PRORP domain-containing protein n=2 Tax=Glycine subgen. Soja TaxID=1462606 RepID=I1M6I0_SOYBN
MDDASHSQDNAFKSEGMRKTVHDVCRVLDTYPWGPALEDAFNTFDEMPQPELVVGVIWRLNDVRVALHYFRWVERKTEQPHCPEAYNALLMLMARTRNLEYLEQILEEMSMAGFGPSNNTCIEMVASFVKLRKLGEAFGVIETMRKFKLRPAYSAYTTLIGSLSAAHEADPMLTLLRQMQEIGYEVSVHLFTMLIRVFAREGRMKSNSFNADLVLYNVCIDCFGKVGKVDMAWKFFHELKSQESVPDDVTYTSMIGVLCKAERVDEAVEMLEELDSNRSVPCVYAYNTMIMGYGSVGKFDEAYSLLERQKRKGCIPSVIAYNCILTCLGRKGKVEEALRTLEEMKIDAVPNLSSYNILIDMLCKAGELEAALKVQDSMKEAGLFPNIMTMLDSGQTPNAVVYTSLIRNFFKCGRKEDGHKIYKEMMHRGCSPDLMLLNNYMDCVFKAGEIEKGRALFEEIKAQGLIPDVRSYSILVHGLGKAGFSKETYKLFYEMKEQGLHLDTCAYNIVIDRFCKSGKVNKAYQLLEEMKTKGLQPTVVTYGSVIDGLAKIDRLDEAYMLFEEANSKGVDLNVVVYSSLIDGFGKVGRIDEAYLILEELMQKGLTPNTYTWNCLLDALVKAEEIDEALVCFQNMKNLKCPPNEVRKFNKAFVFWQEMQKQGLKPNTITHTTMISGLARAGNVLEAKDLFERFKSSWGIPDSMCYNAMIEGLNNANKAMDAYILFEETRLKGCHIYSETCVVFLDALHKADCLEQAAIVGAVLREMAKSQHATRLT